MPLMHVQYSVVVIIGLLTTLCVAVSRTQDAKDSDGAHDLQVLKFSWRKERIGWERDPFSGAVESYDEMRIRARNEKRVEDAKKGGSSGEVDKLKREARDDDEAIARQRQKAPARYVFRYKLSIKNTGARTIKAIDWDYIFLDAVSRSEVGRQQFTSEEKIDPGKARELTIRIRKPPTQTISVSSYEENERGVLSEQVMIVRIEYTDGSIWQRP
jgi:hypothetical protein